MGWTPPHLNGIYVPNWTFHQPVKRKENFGFSNTDLRSKYVSPTTFGRDKLLDNENASHLHLNHNGCFLLFSRN